MLVTLRSTLHGALTAPVLDRTAPLRLTRQCAQWLNMALGTPLASREDLMRRADARRRLAALRASGRTAPVAREAAPVMVYFEKDRNGRELTRIQQLLEGRSIQPRLLDVTGDEAATAFVLRAASCKADDLPIVFVAGKVVGGYRELVDADVGGELARLVFGAN